MNEQKKLAFLLAYETHYNFNEWEMSNYRGNNCEEKMQDVTHDIRSRSFLRLFLVHVNALLHAESLEKLLTENKV